MTRTSGREDISTNQKKIAILAQQEPRMVLTTLAHHIDVGWLREAYRRTRKTGAVGVDGVTAAEYGGPGGESLELARAIQIGSVSGSGGASRLPSQGGHEEDSAHRDTDSGGQDSSAGGADGAGAYLRAGLLGLLVRVSARSVSWKGAAVSRRSAPRPWRRAWGSTTACWSARTASRCAPPPSWRRRRPPRGPALFAGSAR